MSERADMAMRVSAALFEDDLTVTPQVIHRLQGGSGNISDCALVRVGEAEIIKGPKIYPKIVRRILWDVRNASFVDRDGAVVWAAYDEELGVSYVGLGYLTLDQDLVREAREVGLVVVENL